MNRRLEGTMPAAAKEQIIDALLKADAALETARALLSIAGCFNSADTIGVFKSKELSPIVRSIHNVKVEG